jgi:hypothetical protein
MAEVLQLVICRVSTLVGAVLNEGPGMTVAQLFDKFQIQGLPKFKGVS